MSPLNNTRAHAPSDLPPGTTTRWVTHRKGAIVAAVRDGVLTLYELSVKDFTSWQRLADRHGRPACARPAGESARA